jgi:Patatin-like phospholipase
MDDQGASAGIAAQRSPEVDPPRPWDAARTDELRAVQARRMASAAFFLAPTPRCYVRSVDHALIQRDALVRAYLETVRAAAPDAEATEQAAAPAAPLAGWAGLALSGGGVRSATFNLGVLQRLDELGLLQKLDYLSTVSGGGFTGCALAAYATTGAAPPFPFSLRYQDGENIVLRHYRRFSSYLVARGWLDALVAALTAVGGVLANLLILAPFILLVAMAAALQAFVPASKSLWIAAAFVGIAALTGLLYARTQTLPRTATRSWIEREALGRRSALIAAAAILVAAWMIQPVLIRFLARLTWESGAAALAAIGGLIGVLARARFRIALPTLQRPALFALLLLGMLLLFWSTFLLTGATLYLIADRDGTVPTVVVALALAGVLLLLGRRLPVNCGSLHGFYRDRLSKAYFVKPGVPGAQSLEHFDDCQLSALQTAAVPYLLVNACLNLSDAPSRREDLSREYVRPGRKGTFFLFSKHAVGSDSLGYVTAIRFEQDNGMRGSLASAMAISGAAFGPNMGYSTKPALVALLTLLNARTGRWVKFPARAAGGSLLQRLLGDYTYFTLFREAPSRFDNGAGALLLSDGGHVDNLGMYQLLKRRCTLIIAVDAEADPGYAFEGLAASVRLAKIDMGVSVDIDYSHLAGIAAGKRHFAIGNIRYPEGGEGTLIYLKASLTDEALRDVSLLYYHRSRATFPHEPTTDQFFTEQQFEAYRSLGYFICRKTFEGPGAVGS